LASLGLDPLEEDNEDGDDEMLENVADMLDGVRSPAAGQ